MSKPLSQGEFYGLGGARLFKKPRNYNELSSTELEREGRGSRGTFVLLQHREIEY